MSEDRNILKELYRVYMEVDGRHESVVADAVEEIERLRTLINRYAISRKGMSLNWVTDRYGNWAFFDAIDKELLSEAREITE
jgi:hypothetical protein